MDTTVGGTVPIGIDHIMDGIIMVGVIMDMIHSGILHILDIMDIMEATMDIIVRFITIQVIGMAITIIIIMVTMATEMLLTTLVEGDRWLIIAQEPHL